MEGTISQRELGTVREVARSTTRFLEHHRVGSEPERVALMTSAIECFHHASIEMRSEIARVIAVLPNPQTVRARAYVGSLLCSDGLETNLAGGRRASVTADDILRGIQLADAVWLAIEHVSNGELDRETNTASEAKAYFRRG